jgi:molecular chaperone GrpE
MSKKRQNKNPWHERAKNLDKQQDEPVEQDEEQVEQDLDEAIDQEIKAKKQEEIAFADVKQLQENCKESQDKLLRLHAEMDNLRRRTVIDVQNAHKYGLEKLVADLLPVIDSLEKAIEVGGSDQHIEGVKLTLKMLLDALQKHGVEQINSLGEQFDPHLHEAMAMVENPKAKPNEILEVMQKGYTISDRLIRPAMVMVAKE